MLHRHSKKTANITEKFKLSSLNLSVMGTHFSKTASTRDVDAAHNTPPGLHEPIPLT
jgi:hypothetical protein